MISLRDIRDCRVGVSDLPRWATQTGTTSWSAHWPKNIVCASEAAWQLGEIDANGQNAHDFPFRMSDETSHFPSWR